VAVSLAKVADVDFALDKCWNRGISKSFEKARKSKTSKN
jgi:hypothetical protein